jgi:hypothetical protein
MIGSEVVQLLQLVMHPASPAGNQICASQLSHIPAVAKSAANLSNPLPSGAVLRQHAVQYRYLDNNMPAGVQSSSTQGQFT